MDGLLLQHNFAPIEDFPFPMSFYHLSPTVFQETMPARPQRSRLLREVKEAVTHALGYINDANKAHDSDELSVLALLARESLASADQKLTSLIEVCQEAIHSYPTQKALQRALASATNTATEVQELVTLALEGVEYPVPLLHSAISKLKTISFSPPS